LEINIILTECHGVVLEINTRESVERIIPLSKEEKDVDALRPDMTELFGLTGADGRLGGVVDVGLEIGGCLARLTPLSAPLLI